MNPNITNLINSLPYDFYFLVVDKYLDINLPMVDNFYTLSAESLSIELRQKNSGCLLNHPKTIKYITERSIKKRRKVAIIPFKPSAKIDYLCQLYQWIQISNSGKINRILEDKIKFTKLCQDYKIETIPNFITKFNQQSFSQAQKKFGKTLVIQTHFGWAGNSSHLTNDWQQISAKIIPETLVKYTPYLPGYTLINNCCLTYRGLIQSPPGFQYTGIKPFTQNPLATVGRQWPSNSPLEINQQVIEKTIVFSKILTDLKYKGFFGLDYLVHNNRLYLLECNPRLTASFAFYTYLELNQNLTPLFFYHILEFLNIDYPLDIAKEQMRSGNEKIVGSEVTLKNISGTTIKKYQSSNPLLSSTNQSDFEINIPFDK